MSEYNKTDVGEFFVEHTKNFIKEPPVSMWESIESQVPKYNVTTYNKTLLKYLIFSAGVSAIIIVVVMFNKNASNVKPDIKSTSIENSKIIPAQNKINNAIAYNKKPALNVAEPEKTTQTDFNKNTLVNQKQNINTNKKELIKKENEAVQLQKNSKYSINAALFKNVSEIIFENYKNENIIDVKNPQPNAFGYFEIDISKLIAGNYNIYVVSEGKKILHKSETF